ncbi:MULTISPECIES: alpha/beta hydrolase [Subtercola]|uniref:Alpha/beta hydrolase n=1 Tax=Subtercola vilae TaxID=2056433 RepID=A0A4T2C746_9MICO|nr:MULTISPECIES: hypothetical protein [Subtercola]MEA9985007.1 hypothetical protein [Subtercola sp. RTI3]TIH39950.1 hypothetical protein D4765_04130 [Subtercola vilae]
MISRDAVTTPGSGLPSPRPFSAAWAVARFGFSRRHYAGRRAAGVEVHDSMLTVLTENTENTGGPDRVRLRRFATPSTPDDSPLVLVFPDASSLAGLASRSGEWLSSSIAHALPVTVVVVQIEQSVIDDREAAFQVLTSFLGGAYTKIALVGVGTGAALASRTAMRLRDDPAFDAGGVQVLRQALIDSDFQLLLGPPSTAVALRTSLVARLSELPPTLVQQSATRLGTSRAGAGEAVVAEGVSFAEDLPELLKQAGVAVRAIEYPASALSWADYPRAVKTAARSLADLVAFLDRGIVTDGFDTVPAWNLH